MRVYNPITNKLKLAKWSDWEAFGGSSWLARRLLAPRMIPHAESGRLASCFGLASGTLALGSGQPAAAVSGKQ